MYNYIIQSGGREKNTKEVFGGDEEGFIIDVHGNGGLQLELAEGLKYLRRIMSRTDNNYPVLREYLQKLINMW